MNYLNGTLVMLMFFFSAAAQRDVRASRLIADQAAYLMGHWVEQVKNDTMNISGAERSLMTAKAIYELVNARTGIPGIQGDPGIQGLPGVPGTPGVDGTNGAKWFDAAGTPASATGAIGDFYINRTNGDYYEKTGTSTWTVRGNIRGPQGIQGIPGTPGADGTNGANGAPGAQGPKGEDGTSVTIKGSYNNVGSLPGSGSPGDGYMVGDSLWVWDQINDNWHNVGRIRGLQGEQGPSGTPGSKWYDQPGTPNPANGAIGDFHLNRTTGDYYEKTGISTWTNRGNIKGPQGAAGATGAIGPQGIAGATGATGATGLTGSPGAKWFDEAGAPVSATGAIGDFYINRINGDYYEKTGASTWTVRGNLKGPQGSGGGQIINVNL